jgi:hypothetical protein
MGTLRLTPIASAGSHASAIGHTDVEAGPIASVIGHADAEAHADRLGRLAPSRLGRPTRLG